MWGVFHLWRDEAHRTQLYKARFFLSLIANQEQMMLLTSDWLDVFWELMMQRRIKYISAFFCSVWMKTVLLLYACKTEEIYSSNFEAVASESLVAGSRDRLWL